MIGDDIRSVLPWMRQQAESLFTDPCRISREGEPVLDPATGEITTTESVIFVGLCKVQTKDTEARIVIVGSDDVVIQRYEVHVPVTAGPFDDGDIVRVVGRTFRVQGLHAKTWQTAQRLPVVEEV